MTWFLEPATIAEACRLLAEDEETPKVISGGTALALMMGHGLVAPSTLVSLGKIPGLTGVERDVDALHIGAGATLRAVADDVETGRVAPALAQACARVGNIRVRNVATLGGNIAQADYASDPPAALIAFDATCSVEGTAGRRSVEVKDLVTGFYSTSLGRDEIITGLSIPVAGGDRRSSYQRYVSRSSEDRPCVGVAAVADFDSGELSGLKVVVGAVADVPQRFDHVTNQAIGRPLVSSAREAIAEAYAEAIDPIEDARGSAWYRRKMIRVFVRRVLESVSV